MTKKFFTYTALLLLLGLGGCAGAPASETVSPENDTALETYNRAMFSFNNKLDKFVIRPVAKGYRAVTNEYFRQRVTNFFSNIDEPISAANHMLQGEFSDSGNNLGRFVINTTFGLVGLYDVASSMGMEKDKTGFDETLATWCVPDGPFIVLPVVGPSTPARCRRVYRRRVLFSRVLDCAGERRGRRVARILYGKRFEVSESDG